MTSPSPLDVIAADPPLLSVQEAVDLVKKHYGLAVVARILVSERDQNFRLTTEDGEKYVLKIANSAEDPGVTDFQIQALLHIEAKQNTGVLTPGILRTTTGEASFVLESNGRHHVVRVVTYLDGVPLGHVTADARCARNIGTYLARLGKALNDFSHPSADHSLLWDMKQAPALRPLLHHIGDPDIRELATAALDEFEVNALPVFPTLRWQVIHNDMNPDNFLLVAPGSSVLAGVIDFGDMLNSPLIVDVAVAASYQRVVDGNPLLLIAELVAGYHAETPLARAEIDILHDLVKVRLMTTICILAWRESLRGSDDAYLQAAAMAESTGAAFLKKLSEIPRENAASIYSQVCASVSNAE